MLLTAFRLPIANRSVRAGASLLALAVIALWPISARAQYSENMLYDFDFSYSPGIVSDSQGNLYGANLVGGISAGSIFELSPPGNGSLWWTQKTIYTFVLTTGTGPSTGLIFDTEGNLYGATGLQGGTAAQGNCGFVFKLNPPNGGIGEWSESVLHTFAGGNEACGTSNLVMDVQGNLYGASEGGGAKNSGAVYELSPPSSGTGAWNETVIYTFTGGTGGLYPLAPLAIDPSGNLYGTTTYGGSVPGCGSAGCGMVFELSPPSGGGAWTEKTLYTFTGGNDGGNPYSLTLDSQGNLYGGTTTAGNISACISFITLPGCGGIFELSPPPGGSGPWAFSVLHNFSGGDGQGYTSGLVFDSSGALFGATADGGTGTCTADGCGLVFSLTPPSNGTGPWTETVLYDFSGQNDGSTPFPFSPVLLDSRRNIYGTLSLSETTNCSECGAVYELSPTQLVPSHTALIPSMNSANLGDSVTFTATVTPTGPPVPTGTVGFAVNGATMAGCSSVVLSAGQAACSTSALAPGGNSVVAVYSGDTRYSGSAGAQPENVNEPELGLSATPPSVSVKAGGSISDTLSATVIQGTPSGPTTFTCAGLPAGGACSFSPSQVTSFPASVMVTVSTAASEGRFQPRPLRFSFVFALSLTGLLLLSVGRVSGRRRVSWPVGVSLFLVSLLSGCSGSGSGGVSNTGGSTDYNIVVTASASGASSASATIVLTVLN